LQEAIDPGAGAAGVKVRVAKRTASISVEFLLTKYPLSLTPIVVILNDKVFIQIKYLSIPKKLNAPP
jgi:hypothetical protein